MITPLLEALREKDPATWQQIVRGPPMIPYHKYYTYDIDGSATAHKDERAYIPFDELLPEVACAWLQAVLQDACQARGWSWRMQGFPEIDDDHPGHTCCTIMRRKGIIWYDHKTAYGASPAEALLAAYLEAIV